MFKFIRSVVSHAGTPERPSRPLVRNPEENLPLDTRYRMRPDRIYRIFPPDSEERIVPACFFCSGPKFGDTQENCAYCGQEILPRMIDVTDEPNHLPKQEIGTSTLIPTFGGGNIELGKKVTAVVAIGDKVTTGFGAQIERIAGNEVRLGSYCVTDVVVARDEFHAWANFHCNKTGGITAREIYLEANAQIDGIAVVPSFLSSQGHCHYQIIYAGPGAYIRLGSDNYVNKLVVLGPRVKLHLDKGCHIRQIETSDRVQITAHDDYYNGTQIPLKRQHDILGLVNSLVDQALQL